PEGGGARGVEGDRVARAEDLGRALDLDRELARDDDPVLAAPVADLLRGARRARGVDDLEELRVLLPARGEPAPARARAEHDARVVARTLDDARGDEVVRGAAHEGRGGLLAGRVEQRVHRHVELARDRVQRGHRESPDAPLDLRDVARGDADAPRELAHRHARGLPRGTHPLTDEAPVLLDHHRVASGRWLIASSTSITVRGG